MLKAEIRIKETAEGIECEQWWSGEPIDRPCTLTRCFAPNARGRRIAKAYQRAVADGRMLRNAHTMRDINGRTFVVCEDDSMVKYMASTLKRLGYL